MAIETHRKRSNGSIKLVSFLMLLTFIAGILVSAKLNQRPARVESRSLFLDLLSAPGCYVPVTGLTMMALAAAAMGSFYSKQRLDAKARVWQARAGREEALAERQWARSNDLTPGPDGQELARIVRTPDGRLLLVKSGVVTSPVTDLDPDAAVRPDQVSEHLALAAVLGNALGRAAHNGGTNRGGGLSPDVLLLGAALGRPAMAGRVPSTVRVLTEDEAQLLEEGPRE